MKRSRRLVRYARGILHSLLGLSVLLSAASCSTQETKARKAIEDYLKSMGAREVQFQAFYTSKEFPDKAYVSVIITFNFADTTGKYQKEHAGYMLRRDGDGWAVVSNAAYTTEEQKARDYLAGRK